MNMFLDLDLNLATFPGLLSHLTVNYLST